MTGSDTSDTSDTAHPYGLAEALAELQTRLPKIGKDSRGNYGKYADLAAVSRELLPLLGGLGLSFTSKPTLMRRAEGDPIEFVLAYRLLHVSGEADEGTYPLPSSGSSQQIGSAITYARRYSLCAITGAVADEDDDGQTATDAAVRPARLPTAKKPARGKPGPAPLSGAALKAHEALEPALDAHGDNYSRGNTTPPDDPWLTVDQNGERKPPGQLPDGLRDVPSRANGGQIGIIQAHFGRLGFDPADREQRLVTAARIAGRTRISSSKDLTEEEARKVADVLSQCRNREHLVALLAESTQAP